MNRSAEPAALTGIAHVALTVRDVQASAAWYSELLRVPVLAEFDEAGGQRRKAVLASPGLRLGLVEHHATTDPYFDETRIGLDHLAFQVPTGRHLEAWLSRLDRLRVPHSPIAASFLCPEQRVLVFRDPDGVQLEFFEGLGESQERSS
jgi:glyoxylase I family protein